MKLQKIPNKREKTAIYTCPYLAQTLVPAFGVHLVEGLVAAVLDMGL